MQGNAWSPAAMSVTIDELVRRNANFAAGGAFAGLPFPTNQTLRVIGCVDSRVDPSHILGLELGDAVVMRNIGGRVTPAVLRSWALLAKLGQARPSGQPGGSPPHMVVLHHTDCGIKTLADYPEQLAEYFEIPVEELDAKAVRDPHAAVTIDVDIVRRTLPAGLVVSGLVYDVDAGLVEVVVPPATA
jgi:carbonic anhydrase